MKCPKCSYLGFDTGDRCKNCGYDFSLAAAPAQDPDLPLRPAEDLPLFAPAWHRDDEPLIKVPSAPRPPLSVRRTPDAPRLRSVPRVARRAPEPELQFPEEPEPLPVALPAPAAVVKHPRAVSGAAPRVSGKVSAPAPRMLAAVIDHALLGAVDLLVLYFTLRIAALSMADWRLLPAVPMLTFLGMVKLAYFSAFTAVGGQTIGKMAARIRVVTDDGRPPDAALAIRRTLAGAVSVLTLGLAFLPALFTADGRALHDRVARTRVVTLPSA